MMKILNFGSCNIDYVYGVDSIVKPGETISSQSLNVFAGGKGLNQSLAIARSGTAVYHAGCIGKDGLFLKDMLTESGVNTKYLKVCDTASGHAIIQVDEIGENSIILYKGANHLITKDYVDYVLEDFQKDDILVLQNEINNLDYIISKAYEKGLKIVLNPSPINQTILELNLSKIQFLILNQIEACEISKMANIEDICNFFIANYPQLNLVLTLGKNGSLFVNRFERINCNAYSVCAVDTTGAGDTFLGYFISKFSKTNDISDSLNFASMAAALAVTRNGAAESIPFQNEVLSSLNNIK